jgi:hypothetical protein
MDLFIALDAYWVEIYIPDMVILPYKTSSWLIPLYGCSKAVSINSMARSVQ